MTLQNIPIDSIVIPEVRSNAVYTTESFGELKESIASNGIQFPPLVRPLPDNKFELIDGKHRYLCWKELGHTDITADVQELNDEQAAIKHIVANHQRGESDPVGLAKIILKLKDAGKSAEDIGKMIGYSAGTVRQYALVASLPDPFQQALTQGKLKISHVREAMRLEDTNDALAALAYAIQFGWTTPVIHNWVENRIAERQGVQASPYAAQGQQEAVPAPSPELAQMRQCLCCGAYAKAEETVWWTLGPECKGALDYLRTLNANPYKALEQMVAQQNELVEALAKKDAELKELSQKFIDLSLRLQPMMPPAPQPQPTLNPFTQAGPH